ncbi:hypothetical protein BJ508DRAFT_112877 [Ascobolus immersus RN42]|uniref:Myb/SANT-like domain-containing protein n=1 Tax=Ascobolus immersus RN42 TaxID=1160509 RepID=A0A3N4I627_ASCIM|nr:hypothetical protein BJ508DRAFT_112877 [Ascobolus immersus RN42]
MSFSPRHHSSHNNIIHFRAHAAKSQPMPPKRKNSATEAAQLSNPAPARRRTARGKAVPIPEAPTATPPPTKKPRAKPKTKTSTTRQSMSVMMEEQGEGTEMGFANGDREEGDQRHAPPTAQTPTNDLATCTTSTQASSTQASTTSGSTGTGSKTHWTLLMTGKLVEMLKQMILDGRRSDNKFKMDVWNEISGAIITKAGGPMTLTGTKCQARYDTLKKDFDVWKRLSTASGWGCNPVTGQIEQDSIECWEEEIAVASNKSLVRRLQNEPLPFCWELDFIFSGVTATGTQALHPSQVGEIARLPPPYNVTRDRKTPAPGSSTPRSQSQNTIGQQISGSLETIAADFSRMIE